MSLNITNLTTKQYKGVIALLSSKDIEAAAKKTGVNKVTLYRWLKIPEFQQEYRKIKLQFFSDAITTLQKSSNAAVAVLVALMNNPKTSAAVRVNAARITLELTFKGTEFEDVIKRIEVIEKQLEEK